MDRERGISSKLEPLTTPAQNPSGAGHWGLATSPENIGFIAVKFALHDGSFATVLLDYFSARALATLIGSVDKIGWKTAPVLPDERRH